MSERRSILATVDSEGPKEYGIEIVRCFSQTEPSQKGMILRVTDERLLQKTGGIVQGMSGSPIFAGWQDYRRGDACISE